MSPTTAQLVVRFGEPFLARYLAEHGTASPLGLWLLLALVAPLADGPARAELEDVLGTDADDAARRAGELVAGPHPAVASALAVWAQQALLDRDRFDAWAAALPPAAEAGPVPSRADADRWVAAHTNDLVRSFPVRVDAATALVLVSALATRVSWLEPFDEVGAARLGGEFGARVTTALQASPGRHESYLAQTQAAGLVGVQVAGSSDGLRVFSVIAAPEVAPADVHGAAGEIAQGLARRASLFDVPLGPGHAWEVTEAAEQGHGGPALRESVGAVLPAWDAESSLDLAGAEGMAAAFATLGRLLRPEYRPGRFQARQVTVAAFSREGFEAASVTAVAMRAGSAPEPVVVRHRRATIRFQRPYAVLAVATGSVPDVARGWGSVDLGVPAWEGVPVFGAWVARPRP
ncbi:serpin family protein [Cellulomonas sp. ICMP 17802]|uniref:serpin family protein n=1 Tax=Cellulomonas sp. ICMP 17802 TaxID=3239199 RepID=UPI00351BB3BB